MTIQLNGKVVDTATVVVDGIHMDDYPKFCDAHFSEAKFIDGTPLADDQLEQLTDENYDLLADKINDVIYD